MIEAYLLLGVLAGLLAGLLGVGGGLIIVPMLLWIFHAHDFGIYAMHMAVATSLATIIVTSISSSYTHYRHGAIVWSAFYRLLPGIIIGAGFGAMLVDVMPGEWLKTVFAVFEILVAIQMAFSVSAKAERPLPGWPGMLGAGGVIGALSAVIGIGGGTMTVPFLVWCRVGIHKAVATSAACGFPIAVASVLFYTLLGQDQTELPSKSLGYIYWPAFVYIGFTSVLFAPLGAWIAHRLPVLLLKRVFSVVLLLIGVRMLLS